MKPLSAIFAVTTLFVPAIVLAAEASFAQKPAVTRDGEKSRMIFIQKAIEAKKLGGELEARTNKVLDDRARAMVAGLQTIESKDKKQTEGRGIKDLTEYAKGARERDDLLYATAAEVQKVIAGK